MTYEEISTGRLVRIKSMSLQRNTMRTMVSYVEVDGNQEWVVEASEFFHDFTARVEKEAAGVRKVPIRHAR